MKRGNTQKATSNRSMAWLHGAGLIFVVAVVLSGGCATGPTETGVAGMKLDAAHDCVPLAFSPRVVGDKRPDFYSFKTLLASPPFQGLNEKDLARAWTKYFASPKDGCPAMGCIADGAGVLAVQDRPAEALLLLNAYGCLLNATSTVIRTLQGQAMDFVLRPGETVIRSQRCEGRFPGPAHALSFAGTICAEGRHELSQSSDACCASGNGRWIYEPNLAAAYLDFTAGVRDRRGIEQLADGLAGPGQCEFPFVSPYPFVSRPETTVAGGVVYRDGAWITLQASGDVTVEVRDAFGRWQAVPVAAKGAVEKLDISPWVEARCAFAIRLTLRAKARVTKFRFEGYVLTAPMTLPRLEEGLNVMTLRSKDAYGLSTVPCELLPDFRRTAAVPLDQQAEIRNGVLRDSGSNQWQVIAPLGKEPVQATFRFEAPAGERFAWFFVRARVMDGSISAASSVQIDWRVEGERFRPLAMAAASNLTAGCVAAERIMDRPGAVVYVRLTSGWPIGGLEFVGHLDYGAAVAIRPEITHRWLEGTVARQFRAPSAADRYYFRCGPEPYAHQVEMKLPSVMIPVVNDTVRSL